MNFDLLDADLLREEGDKPRAYLDTKGKITIGRGCNIQDVPMDDDLRFELYRRRRDAAYASLIRAFPWMEDQPEPVQRGCTNMVYQLGIGGFMNFRRMIEALQRGDRKAAGKEARDSKWRRQDSPNRAERVAKLIEGD